MKSQNTPTMAGEPQRWPEDPNDDQNTPMMTRDPNDDQNTPLMTRTPQQWPENPNNDQNTPLTARTPPPRSPCGLTLTFSAQGLRRFQSSHQPDKESP